MSRYPNPPDWLDRHVIPDVYPRRDDPFRPITVIPAPTGTPTPGFEPTGPANDLYSQITTPGVRPVVYQRAVNLSPSITATPSPIQQGNFQCDAILVDVPSTSANSAFFGFGSGVTTASGIEVRPGLPLFFSPDNSREQWEIQRLLETIVGMLGMLLGQQTGNPPVPGPGKFMAPRVVMNANDYYLVNAAGVTQSVAVMLFTVPEFQ